MISKTIIYVLVGDNPKDKRVLGNRLLRKNVFDIPDDSEQGSDELLTASNIIGDTEIIITDAFSLKDAQNHSDKVLQILNTYLQDQNKSVLKFILLQNGLERLTHDIPSTIRTILETYLNHNFAKHIPHISIVLTHIDGRSERGKKRIKPYKEFLNNFFEKEAFLFDIVSKIQIYAIDNDEEHPSPIPAGIYSIHESIQTTTKYDGVVQFTIYSTASWDSMITGSQMDINTSLDADGVKSLILKDVSEMSKIESDKLMLQIYLPEGHQFIESSLRDELMKNKPSVLNLYVLVTYKIEQNLLDREIDEVCDTSGQKAELYAPMCKEASTRGIETLACLLGAINHRCSMSDKFIIGAINSTGFAPLCIALEHLYNKDKLTGLNIVEITSSLWQLFKYISPPNVSEECILESSPQYANIISREVESSPVVSIDEETNKVTFKSEVIVKQEFKREQIKPVTQEELDNCWDESHAFMPLKPLSLRTIHTPSLVYGPNNSINLFKGEKHDGNNSLAVIVTPNNGESQEVEVEQYAMKTSKDNEVIDEDFVSEMTIVLFDQSGSMSCRIGHLSRIELAKQFLTMWAKKQYDYRINCLRGLVSFDDEITIQLPLDPLKPNFEKSVMGIETRGGTELWYAIDKACDLLLEKKQGKYKNAKLRILVVSDGEDSCLSPDLYDKIIQNNITVDCIIVSDEDNCRPLGVFCQATGGLAMKPETTEDAMFLFGQEAVLSLGMREERSVLHKKLNYQVLREMAPQLQYDKEVKNKVLMKANQEQNLVSLSKVIDRLRSDRSDRSNKITKELGILEKWANDGVKVFGVKNSSDLRIYFKGPSGTPYANKWWYVYLVFPELYPEEPPHLRFVTIPYHINISNEGRVFMNSILEDYTVSTSVRGIICDLMILLKNPDMNRPIDENKLNLFNSNRTEYDYYVQKSVEQAQSDYAQYLRGINIFD